MTNDNEHTIAVGRYTVTPLVKQLEDGRFAASVSVRSGHGSGMHDRVLRFSEAFANAGAAMRYATEQGLQWVSGQHAPPAAMP